MRVIAHDPYVAQERAQSLGVELLSQDEVLGQSDFISLHMRVTPQTRDLIDDEQIAKMKRGARIINTARGELIDDAALLRALDSGQLAGAAIDVFREEPPGENPLLSHDKVIVTPHLGALTEEAQERAATDVGEQVLAVLRGEPARYAVNAPLVSEETMKVLRPFFEVAERIASIATQISDGQLKAIEIEYLGEIANHDTTPLKAAVIKGLLAPVSEENVTVVNANLIAEERGLKITERSGPSEEYTNLLTIKLETDVGVTTIAGSVLHESTHIERVNEFWVDIPLDSEYLLICQNQDRPGMVGAVGAFLGEQDINISFMKVGREKVRGNALMVMGLDDEISPELLRKLESISGLHAARLAKL
ncbi:MAG: ACT domain-containing protein, partial [Chloroflexi bacterium]|nr:ACT domain-containing protein [Chloroflexota bacterium]